MLEHDVGVAPAGGGADRLAEPLHLGDVRLARVAVDEVELAPVDHGRGAEALAEVDLVLGRDDRDGVRAVQAAELQRHRPEPAAGAPHEHVVAGLHAGLVDQHAVRSEVDERVGRRLLPRQVLRLRHELLRLDARVVGERAPVGLVAPDLLLRAGHRVEAVALRALAARLVAVDDDLVARLPALDARTRRPRRCPRRPSRRCGNRRRYTGRWTPACPSPPTRGCSSHLPPSPARAPRPARVPAPRRSRAASRRSARRSVPAGSPRRAWRPERPRPWGRRRRAAPESPSRQRTPTGRRQRHGHRPPRAAAGGWPNATQAVRSFAW